MIKIQLIDDEPAILSALKRILRNEGWELETFTDPQDALGALTHTTYAVIICDMRMPQFDGIAYLQVAKQMQPTSMRLLLSGHGDRDSLTHAINRAEIYRFISKPWDDYELLTAVRTAVDLHQLHDENRRLLNEVKQQKQQIKQHFTELQRLHKKHPQLLELKRGEDGSILLDDDR